MLSISEGIGNGAVKDLEVKDAIDRYWCDFITIDVKLKCSESISSKLNWHCKSGITMATMPLLNEEFNY